LIIIDILKYLSKLIYLYYAQTASCTVKFELFTYVKVEKQSIHVFGLLQGEIYT